MNERLKELRLANDFSQEEMGKILGISKSGVSDIESGRRKVTEQHIIMLKNCKLFNLNEDWLRYGTGEMLLSKSHEEEIADLTFKLLSEESTSFKNRFVSALSKLTDDQWDMLEQIIDDISAQKKE